MQARTPAVQVPPQHAWEAMAQYAPKSAELACQSMDIASAHSYFVGVRGCVNLPAGLSPHGKRRCISHTACIALQAKC